MTMFRTTGTLLLAIGFAMLTLAWVITDPYANDANIGAGGLNFFGRPAAGSGIVILVADAVLRARRKRRVARPSVS
ncbi:hypothetical protein E3T61_07155 [Cryobacterium lactosi]|uniref:Uncharacterized protein n=1 Tax=Cryobacterium lactosi TaxID=1259202 RepID=A0A4R9BXP3_9MICO|nr:hypothetical protein [Cryobacterium lactosi]TFD92081.1 hypothetical protein E3T61_07155 [Cryobacterium lactosi]